MLPIRTGVAATVVTGLLAPTVWLALVGMDDTIRFVLIEDPLAVSHPAPRTVLLGGSVPAQTQRDPSIAFHPDDGRVYLAFSDIDSTRLRVASASLAEPFDVDPRFPTPQIDGAPAIVAHGPHLYAAYVASSDGVMRVARVEVGSAADAEVFRVLGRADEHDPFLVSTASELLLLTASGRRSVCDIVHEASCERLHLQLARRWTGAGFTGSTVLRRLPIPFGLDVPPELLEEPIGNPVASDVDEVGPAAIEFQNRVQFFVPHRGGEFDTGLMSYFSFSAGGSAGVVSGSESRILGHDRSGLTRVAPIVFPHGGLGDLLLVYWSNEGGELNFKFKRSD